MAMENAKDDTNTAAQNETNNKEVVEILKIVNPVGSTSFLEYFKHKDHSLSINASSVAACVGYHEFQSIPELMLKHVYQGGQRLLEHDAKLLGLELVLLSAEQQETELLQLAKSSGSQNLVRAVQRALKVKHGHESIRSVEEAQKLKRLVSQEATKLAPHQLQALQESTRQAIDTGCGHSWEEQALDQYEDECGWEVRERNAECRVWEFEKIENDDTSSGNDRVPSIQPMGPARPRRRRKRHHTEMDGTSDNLRRDDHEHYQRYDSRGVKRKLSSAHDSQISLTALMDFDAVNSASRDTELATIQEEEGEPIEAEEIASVDVLSSIEEHVNNPSRQSHNAEQADLLSSHSHKEKPFLTIRGMVDGIRDELGPTTWPIGVETKSTDDDDDDDDDELSCESFSLSRVVVECKHRMNKLLNGPRFSECIQAVVYCFMYETDDADIVQVLRSQKPRITNEKPRKEEKEGLLAKYFQKVTPSGEETESGDKAKDEKENKIIKESIENDCKQPNGSISETANDEDMNQDETKEKPSLEENDKRDAVDNNITMTIAVDRVSLDDPNFGHRSNWKAVILPKLRQWADAVYRIRQSDDKRYRLLSSLSMADANADNEHIRKEHAKAAWELVLEECDFLREGMSGERYRRETQ